MDKNLFLKPSSIFQEKINTLLKNHEISPKIMEALFKLYLAKFPSKKQNLQALVKLYNYLGIDRFFEIIDLLGGEILNMPKREDLKEIINVIYCFCLRINKNKPWKEIKKILKSENITLYKCEMKVNALKDRLYNTMFEGGNDGQ